MTEQMARLAKTWRRLDEKPAVYRAMGVVAGHAIFADGNVLEQKRPPLFGVAAVAEIVWSESGERRLGRNFYEVAVAARCAAGRGRCARGSRGGRRRPPHGRLESAAAGRGLRPAVRIERSGRLVGQLDRPLPLWLPAGTCHNGTCHNAPTRHGSENAA